MHVTAIVLKYISGVAGSEPSKGNGHTNSLVSFPEGIAEQMLTRFSVYIIIDFDPARAVIF